MMHGREKSDPGVVAGKPANKAERSAAEPVERRAGAEGHALRQSAFRTQRRADASQALERIRQAVALPSHTQGGSRMRESRLYGSVRGRAVMRVPTAIRNCWRPFAPIVLSALFRPAHAPLCCGHHHQRNRRLARVPSVHGGWQRRLPVFADVGRRRQPAVQRQRTLGSRRALRLRRAFAHHPRIEERALLFIDMRASTAIAGRLGQLRFLDPLNRLILDVSFGVAEAGGEIHKYVADEVIAIWRLAGA